MMVLKYGKFVLLLLHVVFITHLVSVFLELPVSVVEGAHLSRLEPPEKRKVDLFVHTIVS